MFECRVQSSNIASVTEDSCFSIKRNSYSYFIFARKGSQLEFERMSSHEFRPNINIFFVNKKIILPSAT